MKKYTNWAVLQFDDSLTGNAQESAQVKVYLAGTTTEAAIFSDVSGTTPIVQPILTNTTAQENPGRFEFYSAGGLFDIVINEGAADETKIEDVSISTEVNVKDFGAVGDGVTDDTLAIQAALDSGYVVHIPSGNYRVTSTLTIGARGVAFIGESELRRDYNDGRVSIIYDGATNAQTAVIQIGNNAVGDVPSTDSTSNVLKNIYIDCQYKAGIGVYSTYMTNESLVDSVTVSGATEFGHYYAKGWYATIKNITAIKCKGNGLAFGMPLVLQDGTDLSSGWGSSDFQLNQVSIDNVRSSDAGEYYSVDNTSTYDPTDSNIVMKGYGIGAGEGNGFSLSNFTSEGSGGCNLYIYNKAQIRRTIQLGYIEDSCKNSGLSASSTTAGIIIDNVGVPSGVEIKDIFTNYNNGGGIYHRGLADGKVWIKNIHQPRFLKSLNTSPTLSNYELYNIILKENVRYECGYYNTREELMYPSGYALAQNVRYAFTVNCLPTGGRIAIYIREASGVTPTETYTITYDDGTTKVRSYPTLTTEYQLAYVTSGNVVSITKSGTSAAPDKSVDFKVLSTPTTYF